MVFQFGERVTVTDKDSLFIGYTGIIVEYVGGNVWRVYFEDLDMRVMFHYGDLGKAE